MHYTTLFATLLAIATSSFAAPTPASADAASDISARGPSWTLKNFSRRCDSGSCTFGYTIVDGANRSTDCYYKSAGPQASYEVTCGKYKVTSAWSDQFGAENGFSTMSVVRGNQIVYPSYSDAELAGGKAVKPDRVYVVATI